MSTLTKVLIVFFLLLSVAYAFFALTYFSYQRSYLALWETQKEVTETLELEKKRMETALRNQLAILSRHQEDIAARLGSLTETNQRLRDQISGLEHQNRIKDNRIAELAATSMNSTAQIQSFQAKNDDLQRQVRDLQGEIRNERERADLANAAFHEIFLHRNIVVEERDALARRLNETANQLAEHRRVLEVLKERGIDPAEVMIRAVPSIHGYITQVRPEDGVLMLDVGSEDQVQQGMVFNVHRGEEWLGEAEVYYVTPSWSAAIAKPKSAETIFQMNDQVYTR